MKKSLEVWANLFRQKPIPSTATKYRTIIRMSGNFSVNFKGHITGFPLTLAYGQKIPRKDLGKIDDQLAKQGGRPGKPGLNYGDKPEQEGIRSLNRRLLT